MPSNVVVVVVIGRHLPDAQSKLLSLAIRTGPEERTFVCNRLVFSSSATADSPERDVNTTHRKVNIMEMLVLFCATLFNQLSSRA
jgi:hypothetical protein